jgi:EAL domain-containing protein (putative c-di-GMP-specific phosphodiesterase class I)
MEEGALDDALSFQELDGPNPALLRHALKLTMDRFTASDGFEPTNLANMFEVETRETQKRAAALQSRVRLRNFSLVYQPIVDLGSGAVHHSEALIRFRDGESPFEVIKFAEATGFIQELDWATINEALTQLRGNAMLAPIAVNLSAQSLMAERFISEIISTYKRVPAARDRFLLEITESSALTELDAANGQIQRLRAAGVEVALDDFGAGAASLSYLQRLEVDTVKIDADYIRNLVGAARSRSIVQNIAQLCSGLGAATVGEGVETRDVADILRSLGVDYGQGWCFGKPQAAPPILTLVATADTQRTAAPARRAKG